MHGASLRVMSGTAARLNSVGNTVEARALSTPAGQHYRDKKQMIHYMEVQHSLGDVKFKLEKWSQSLSDVHLSKNNRSDVEEQLLLKAMEGLFAVKAIKDVINNENTPSETRHHFEHFMKEFDLNPNPNQEKE